MAKYYALLVVLFMSLNLSAQTYVPAGAVSGTWQVSGSPYKIQGNISVLNGTTLTIEPGVVVEFQGKYKLFCNGRILAIGTAAERITFTTTTANIANGWLGIRFDYTPITNEDSHFSYCNVKYGKADTDMENTGGGFFFNHFSGCTIENCNITNNFAQDGGSAISCLYASPLIKGCTFSGNTTYQGGICTQFIASKSVIEGNTFIGGGIESTNSDLIIRYNHITGNTQYGIWSFTTNPVDYIANMVITDNIIENNHSDSGLGGGGICLLGSTAKIEHNIIRNNSTDYCGGAITCWNHSWYGNANGTVISNNLIYGNSSGDYDNGMATGGGAILLSNNSPKIINNTIYNNTSFYNGGGIRCISDSDPEFYNNIIYDNKVNNIPQNILLSENSCDPLFYNNNLQGGLIGIDDNDYEYTGDYLNNINEPALFSDAAAGDFSLSEDSPCINTGTSVDINLLLPENDLNGNPRLFGNSIDMGAYEFQQALGVGLLTPVDRMYCYPNPAGEKVTLSDSFEKVSITDINGKTFNVPVDESRQIDTSHLPSGIYFLTVTKGSETSQIKLIRK